MASTDEPLDPAVVVRAAIDVLVFAPLGLGVKLVEDAPDAVDKARRELSNARFIGRLAVGQGIKQVRSRLESRGRRASPSVGADQPSNDDVPPKSSVDRADSDEPAAIGLLPGDLALPDYDTLPAIDIVAKLATLDEADRTAIERYEMAHRRRRTVLGKLAQLADL